MSTDIQRPMYSIAFRMPLDSAAAPHMVQITEIAVIRSPPLSGRIPVRGARLFVSLYPAYQRMCPEIGTMTAMDKKRETQRLLPIRKHREERENGIASAVPFSHFSIDAVTFDISKAPMPL